MKLRIYMSGAFTNVNNWTEVSKKYEYAAHGLEIYGFDTYLPHSKTPPTLIEGLTTEDVFLCDYNEIRKSDIVFAFLDYPSHGVGAEIALALNLGLTVVGVCHTNIRTSRFIVGLLQHHPNGYFYTYENLDEIPFKFSAIIKNINNYATKSSSITNTNEVPYHA